MPDRIGYRAKWGLVTPSRNTVIEHEFHMAAPHGITVNTARAVREGATDWAQLDPAQSLGAVIRAAEPAAIVELKDCQPDRIIIGDGAFTFALGEHARLSERYGELAGVPVTVASDAFRMAFEALGVRRVALMSEGPVRPESIKQPGGWEFDQLGYELTAAKSLNNRTAFDIVNASEDRVRALLEELARSKPDAIVASGSNQPLMLLAGEAERWLGLPVLHINTVLLWHALRSDGFADQMQGLGVLLRNH